MESRNEFYSFIEVQQKKILDSSLPLKKKEGLCSLILKTKDLYEKMNRFYPEDSYAYFEDALEVISEYTKRENIKDEEFDAIGTIIIDSYYALEQLNELQNTLEAVKSHTTNLKLKLEQRTQIEDKRGIDEVHDRVVGVNNTVERIIENMKKQQVPKQNP